jgi:hypothetical protein
MRIRIAKYERTELRRWAIAATALVVAVLAGTQVFNT